MIGLILSWLLVIIIALAAWYVVTRIIIPNVPAQFQWICWIAFGLICLVALWMLLTGQITPPRLI